jgi:serine/threonine-protein kinase
MDDTFVAPNVGSPTTYCPHCGLEYTGGEVFCPNDGTRLVARESSLSSPSHVSLRVDPLLGQTVAGRYRILRQIGEGGMGIVYEAEHVVIEKRVGLKVLRDDFSRRPDVVERFRQEARSASKIGHEHIIDISDFGETGSGANFFVMELLDGHDLAEELARKGALPARRTIGIVLQCAKALSAAHKKGIVHRDMKPENVFLVKRDGGDDFVKIVDFGIAKMSDIETEGRPGRKLTKTGMIFGTPEYMSPEQAGGKKFDHRVDIYSLGVILYELLAGRVPFVGDTFMGILTQHMFDPAPPITSLHPRAQVPPELERIVWKALAKNPDDRYPTMDALAIDLELSLAATASAPSAMPVGTVTHHGEHEMQQPKPAPRVLLATPTADPLLSTSPAWTPRRWFLPAVLLVAVLGALGSWLARSEVMVADDLKRAKPRSAPPPPEAPALQPASAGMVTAPETKPAPGLVLVHVVSKPDGAAVHVDGRGEVCRPTPCDFTIERDRAVNIEVSLNGYLSSKTAVLPSRDENAVEIALRKRTPSRAKEPSGAGDLKIPDAFTR